MIKILTGLFAVAMTAAISHGEDVVFHKSLLVDYDLQRKGRVDLLFAEDNKAIVVRDKKSIIMVIPYASIVRLTYFKNHRFEILYEKAGTQALFGLDLDESEYKSLLVMAPIVTGKELQAAAKGRKPR